MNVELRGLLKLPMTIANYISSLVNKASKKWSAAQHDVASVNNKIQQFVLCWRDRVSLATRSRIEERNNG